MVKVSQVNKVYVHTFDACLCLNRSHSLLLCVCFARDICVYTKPSMDGGVLVNATNVAKLAKLIF